MANKFSKLEAKMSPERIERSNQMAREMMAEMLLSELRKHTGTTQQQLADLLGVKQPSLSQLESQSDMQVSTLKRLIEALGGKLEFIAHLPEGDIRITQFDRKTA